MAETTGVYVSPCEEMSWHRIDEWDAGMLNIFGNVLLESITCADTKPRGILGESSNDNEHQDVAVWSLGGDFGEV